MESPKYNRTYHLPFSEGATNDDKIQQDVSVLLNQPIVITEKLDGSNVSMEREGCFARTHSGPPTHPSFDEFKVLHATVKYLIPDNLQIFGENVAALHSIAYKDLPGYFHVFGVRDLHHNSWLSWEEVEMWAEELGVPTVPVLFKGIIKSFKDLKQITDNFMQQPSLYGDNREGVVVRIEKEFKDEEFPKSILKRVRFDHVKSSTHWKFQEIVKNILKFPR